MKLEWNTEAAMLQMAVLPGIEKAKSLLEEGKCEETQRVVAKDILGLLIPYRDMENEKFLNAPDNLQSAPNVMRMEKHVKLMNEAIGLLYDEKTQNLRPCGEWDLEAVADFVGKAIQS